MGVAWCRGVLGVGDSGCRESIGIQRFVGVGVGVYRGMVGVE